MRITAAYERLNVSKGFLFEQEPIFTYKSSTFIDNPESSLWVVVFTERVVRVCVALLFSAYNEYRLWHVPSDIIAFSGERSFAMEVPLGSPSKIRNVLEFLEGIEATEFDTLPAQWRERSSRSIDYHPGRTRCGGDFFFYDPWRKRKIDEQSERVRGDAVRVIPDSVQCVWVQPKRKWREHCVTVREIFIRFMDGRILSSVRGQLRRPQRTG